MNVITAFTETTHRAATWDDIPAIVELCNHVMVAMWGVPEWSIPDTEKLFSRPGFVPEEYGHLWHDKTGRLVGMGLLSNLQEPPVRVRVMPYILPTLPDLHLLGMEVMAWGEEVVRRVALPRSPHHAKVQMLAWTNRTYTPYRDLYEAYDMALIRQYWTMHIDLHADLPLPQMPEGVTIRTLRYPEESHAMYRMSDEAFADHYGYVSDPEMQNYEGWAHQRFNDQRFDPSLWFIAEVDGTYAGFSWCSAGAADDPLLGFVETLGVLPAFRRRGLATLLLHHSFRELYRRGMHKAELEVDATNITGATRVYAAAGMTCQVVWDTYAKVLRDGIEIVRE
jgi:mycothiol synthase